MLAAEAFKGCRGVHVGYRDDRLAARSVRRRAEQPFELLPAIGDGIEVGHVGHGAAGGEVRQDNGLVGAREHVCGLGHEMDAAEDDGLGLGASPGGVRELEGVADEVGVLNDFVALIEVAEDDQAFTEFGLGARMRRSSSAFEAWRYSCGSIPCWGDPAGRVSCIEAPGP